MTDIVGTPKIIKLLNKDVIEEIIKNHGPITKPEIAAKTNLSLVTVNKTVAVLLKENKLKCGDLNESTGGRRAQTYIYNEELIYYIGLYFEKDTYLGAVSNSLGTIIYQNSYPVRISSPEYVMEDTFTAIDKLIEHCESHLLAAIGLGVPGVVNKGIVTNIPIIPSWEGKDITKILNKKYNLPILLENDVNLTTVGVYREKYKKKVRNMVLIYLEKGIGSGLIINKELYRGFTNFAGELSYLPVNNDGIKSGQSKYKGNFEQRIAAINEQLEQKSTLELLQLLFKTVAEGILSIICVLNPEIIVIKNHNIKNSDLKMLQEILGNYIESSNIPQMVCADDLTEYSIKGVIDMCVMETTSSYSLSSKKGR